MPRVERRTDLREKTQQSVTWAHNQESLPCSKKLNRLHDDGSCRDSAKGSAGGKGGNTNEPPRPSAPSTSRGCVIPMPGSESRGYLANQDITQRNQSLDEQRITSSTVVIPSFNLRIALRRRVIIPSCMASRLISEADADTNVSSRISSDIGITS